MDYKMSVQEFLQMAENGNIDLTDFILSLNQELEKINRQLGFLREISPLSSINSVKSLPKLFGLPISVKDCICVKGMQATAGSRILAGYVPPFDATVVKRIKENAGTIIGKTNQDEFGFGTFSTNSCYEIPKNPLDPNRVCGGSSGGAGGLTQALELPHIALGQSTGGSISCPSAWCSVIGLTPTYGLVSRYGLIDYANSLDKIGPIGKNVFDIALLLSIIAGYDEKDSTSINKSPADYTIFTQKQELHGVKLAIPKEYLMGLDKNVEKEFWVAVKKLEDIGAEAKEVKLPNTKISLSAYYIVAASEASTNLAKYCGMRYGLHEDIEGMFNEYFSKTRGKSLGQEAKRRIMLGTFARMSGYRDAYYVKAMKVRTLIIQDFKNAFKHHDAIIAPTMPILPPKFIDIEKLTPSQIYAMDALTVPANFAGIPHISIPVKEKTPIGLHILGDHLQEGKIIEIAAAFEKSR